VPGFDAIIGQPRPIRILTRLLDRGILPHALLFTGMEGVGKKTTAAAVVMACLCPANSGAVEKGGGPKAPGAGGCGRCAACRKVAADAHPDLRRLAPTGGMIKIEPIRELCTFLSMKPFEARMRAVIIADAHALNPSAGNALLKMLEEPPPQTVMILTTAQAGDVMPTVVSRCRQIHFPPLARRDVAAILMRDHGQDPEAAERVAAAAAGSATRALALLDERVQRRRAWLMAQLAELPGQSPAALMALAEKLARERSEFAGDLDLIAAWLRDVAVARECPEQVVCREALASLTSAARRLPAEEIAAAVDALQETHRRLRANANPRLSLEALFFRLAARFRPAA
jgi:DNA polymerase-3 subunit delta'